MKTDNKRDTKTENKPEKITEKNYKNMIEALLFASGRYMSIETLINLTKAENKEIILENIQKLKQEYESRESPLMIVEEKDGFKLTVKESYLPLVRKIVSETELPKTILETLAVIAWKNPAKQSDIIKIRHNKAYDHIEELEELDFIKKEKKGRSFILKLTEKFYNYFDIEGVKDIKDVFKRVVEKNLQNQNKPETKLIETSQKSLEEITDLKETENKETEKNEKTSIQLQNTNAKNEVNNSLNNKELNNNLNNKGLNNNELNKDTLNSKEFHELD